MRYDPGLGRPKFSRGQHSQLVADFLDGAWAHALLRSIPYGAARPAAPNAVASWSAKWFQNLAQRMQETISLEALTHAPGNG